MQISKSESRSTITPDFVGSDTMPAILWLLRAPVASVIEPMFCPILYLANTTFDTVVNVDTFNPDSFVPSVKPNVIPLPITCPVYADLFGKLNVQLTFTVY